MKDCINCKHKACFEYPNPCDSCTDIDHTGKPTNWEAQTHGDRIRAKSDEELAEFLGTLPCCPPGEDLEELCIPLDSCEGTDFNVKCWLKWLRQEAEEKP